jgi:hypothetical protein
VYRPPSPAESRDYGFHDDYLTRIERERNPYNAALGIGTTYSRGIRSTNSQPFWRRNSYSGASADYGFHDDKTPSESTPTNNYGPPPSSSSSSFTSQPRSFHPGSYGATASFPPPPPGPSPIELRAKNRRATDRYGMRGTEDERFIADINSPRDAEKWDRYQESRGIAPDRFDRPYERDSISIEPRDLRGAPPDE